MPWPSTRPHIWSMDQQTDAVRRDHILAIAQMVIFLLDSRGYTGDAGLASLENGRVPDSQLGKGEPGGVATLGGDGRVLSTQLPLLSSSPGSTSGLPASARGRANGVASLDATGKVPLGQLPAPGTITTIYGGTLDTPSTVVTRVLNMTRPLSGYTWLVLVGGPRHDRGYVYGSVWMINPPETSAATAKEYGISTGTAGGDDWRFRLWRSGPSQLTLQTVLGADGAADGRLSAIGAI